MKKNQGINSLIFLFYYEIIKKIKIKKEIKKQKVRELIEKPEELKKIIQSLKLSEKADDISLQIYGVLTQEQKDNLHALIDDTIEDKKVKKETLELGIKILKLISSIHNKKPKNSKSLEEKILANFKNSGIALEYFFIDAIKRVDKKRKIKIQKGPAELDAKKIDMVIENGGLKYGVQLTNMRIRRNTTIEKQKDMMKKCSQIENNSEGVLTIKDELGGEYIYDVPVLIIINGKIKEGIHNNNRGKNIFENAYGEWKEKGYNKGGPTQYLEKSIKDELYLIAGKIEELINAFIKYLQTGNKPSDNTEISLTEETKNGSRQIKVTLSKSKHFICSLEFFVPNNFKKHISQ